MWNDPKDELASVQRMLAYWRDTEKLAQDNVAAYAEREQKLLEQLQGQWQRVQGIPLKPYSK